MVNKVEGVEFDVTVDGSGAVDENTKIIKSNESLEKSFEGIDKSTKNTSKGLKGSLAGMSRSAGQAGIQIQQLVGQIQGGQSPMLALSQQAADLGIVLGAPLVGAIAGLTASFASALIPTLFNAKTEVEELEERLVNFRSSLKETDEVSKGAFKQVEIGKLESDAVAVRNQIESVKQSLIDLSTGFQSQAVTSQIGGLTRELVGLEEQLTKITNEQAKLFEAGLEDIEFKGIEVDDIIPSNEEFIARSQSFFTQFEDLNNNLLQLQTDADNALIEQNRAKLEKIGEQEKLADERRLMQLNRANQLVEASYSNTASLILSTLDQIVGGNDAAGKAIRIASGATAAYMVWANSQAAAAAMLAPPPLGLGPVAGAGPAAAIAAAGKINAALVVAQAAAGAFSGGSAGGSQAAGQAAQQQPAQQQSTTPDRIVQLQGVQPGLNYDGRLIIDAINIAQADGARITIGG